MARRVKIKPYWGPVGGWGSARAVSEILLREGIPIEGPPMLLHQNKPSGYACVSCSYAKPGHPRPLEFCENGAKATGREGVFHRGLGTLSGKRIIADYIRGRRKCSNQNADKEQAENRRRVWHSDPTDI
jgi:hypothetical protein